MTDRSGEVRPGELATRAELPAEGGHVHLVGIGGAGMRGLAVVLEHAGYRVSGCDRGGVEGLDELAARGIALSADHDPSHAEGADALVRSSAVPPDAEEVRAAERTGVPVLRRARALGALLNGHPLVGVAGTHGKTTITAMTAIAAEVAELDPTALVGGRVAVWDGFARVGEGPAIVEADEYDRSFLELDPTQAIVSSLEPEHLDTYGSFDAVRSAFRDFAGRAVPRDGVWYCADDPGARALGEELAAAAEGERAADGPPPAGAGPDGGNGAEGGGLSVYPTVRSYGFTDDAWLRIGPPAEPDGEGGRFGIGLRWPGASIDVPLRVPGRHNAQNAAAAFGAALVAGGDPGRIAEGLAAFEGVGRRLEVLLDSGGLTLIDDYAHHPTEVAASLEALRSAYPGARLDVVFQPHLYSRTREFAGEFAGALAAADRARVLPIYPAREEPIPGVTSDLITAEGAAEALDPGAAVSFALEGGGTEAGADAHRVLVFMGAGSVTRLAHDAREAVRARLGEGA